MSQTNKKMREYMSLKHVEQFGFGAERTFGCVPLLRDNQSCNVSVAEKVVSDIRFCCCKVCITNCKKLILLLHEMCH